MSSKVWIIIRSKVCSVHYTGDLFNYFIGNCIRNYIGFPLKNVFWTFPGKVINYNKNELIYFSQKFSWDPGNIFRLGSKPKSLHICKIRLENVEHHVPNKCKNVEISDNRFVGVRIFWEKSIPYATSGHAHEWKTIVH